MKNLMNKYKSILFTCYVGLWLILDILFGTNIIHLNVKQYMYEHFPIWLNLMFILISIFILIYLWPKTNNNNSNSNIRTR